MFERFTAAARDVITVARDEALKLHSGRIGTEHLLLALAAGTGPARTALDGVGVSADALRAQVAGGGPDAEALASIGIDLDAVRSRVEASFGPGALERPRGCRGASTPVSKRAKKVLELAVREAVARGDRRIGPEHILLGILRDGEGRGIAALRRLGVAPERLRDALEVRSA